MDYCVDANIFVNALSADENFPSSTDFLRHCLQTRSNLHLPSLVQFEVMAALQRKRQMNLLSDKLLQNAQRLFFDLPILLTWRQDLIQLTFEIQNESGLKSFYDASYLALAKMKNIPLITHDKEILKKGKASHQSLYTPQSALA